MRLLSNIDTTLWSYCGAIVSTSMEKNLILMDARTFGGNEKADEGTTMCADVTTTKLR